MIEGGFLFLVSFQLKVGRLKVSFRWKGFGAIEGKFFLLGFRLKVGFRWKGLLVEGEFLVEWVFV